jgi:hypothetical protein
MTTSKGMELRDRELLDGELDAVTGGLVVISIIAILIGQLLPDVPATKAAAAPAPSK